MNSLNQLVATVIGNRGKAFSPSIERQEKQPVIVDLPGHVRHWFTGIQMQIISEVTEYPDHMLVRLPNGSTHLYYNPNA